MRLFNDGWQFAKNKPENWQPVTLPHDWLIYDAQNLYETSIGWYKNTLYAHLLKKNQRLFIRFDGVYMDSALFVNGKNAGEWKYGYTAFEHDITDFIDNENTNELLMKVDYKSPNSRWYSGAGIYRDVFLIIKNETHFVSDGIYITPKRRRAAEQREVAEQTLPLKDGSLRPLESGLWEVTVSAEVIPHGKCSDFTIKHTITDASGKIVSETAVAIKKNVVMLPDRIVNARPPENSDGAANINSDIVNAEIIRHKQQPENSDGTSNTNIDSTNAESIGQKQLSENPCVPVNMTAILLVNNPELWDTDTPNLYFLKSELLINGEIMDTSETRFGFREVFFSANDGFFLNSKHVKLHGVCQHHDTGALGAAADKNAIKRQLLILREMGVNAIRTAHNPPARVFMELADEMGFLVMSEFADMWKLPKTEYDYARFFDEWAERDAASWIRRDRNCPSVIMWSIGNEIYDTHADFEQGAATLKKLMGFVAAHDPDTHAAVTLCSNYMPWENTQKCADIIKLIGYNYAEYLYNEHHAAHPDWLIFGSETASTVQSRGVYHFPFSKFCLADDDCQCSALGNSSTSWGAKSVEAFLTDDRDAEFSLGQFIWTGTDYIGEPTPYQTKNSYFGHIDTAGFPKDSFYVIKSAWTDYRKAPFVHIFPYWDFSAGQEIDVRVCSNAPATELFLNGKSLGVYNIDHKKGKDIVGTWSVLYESGELKAVAYDNDGNAVAETVRRSFGDASALKTKTDIIGNLAFIEITAVDKAGNPVENANNRVLVTVKNGELLGLDNGDSSDFDEYKTNNRRLFNGKLLAIARIDVDSTRYARTELSGALPIRNNGPFDAFSVSAEFDERDIPIRKIELTSDGFTVKAKTYPENATYNDLSWRLTDAGGIDSPLGSIAVSDDGKTAVITPKGDGRLYIRCAAKNGKKHADFYSLLTIALTGMGAPFLNPYTFISGGLYNLSNAEMTNGNERGVATLRDGESHVGFGGLDFGDYGADEVIIPIFSLSAEPFDFEIWEGMPEVRGQAVRAADGRPRTQGQAVYAADGHLSTQGQAIYAADGQPRAIHLGTFTYDKGSVWNTYQEITCKLSKRLKGVTTLCFVFRQKVHIKGFRFNAIQKAYQTLYAAENDGIYGDSFLVESAAVVNIGNNVSIMYKNMDFGTGGTNGIIINSRSVKDKNSVKCVFTNENGEETAQMLEIPGNADYGTNEFLFAEPVTGKVTVSLIFLPGCKLDLMWFQFKSNTAIPPYNQR